MDVTRSARRHDLDWLRVGAIYLLFVFHVAMVFNPAPFYHIRNADLSGVMLVVAGFISLWHMPLLFLLAGWSAFASLRDRGTARFLRERFFKLWIPLVMSCVLLMPPIKYVELLSGLDANYTGLRVSPALQEGFRALIPGGLPEAAPFDERFVDFLPTFFTQLERFTWAHLWFVVYLLVFTLLYLPGLTWLARRPARPAPARAAWIYLPALPLALIQVTLRPYWPGLQNLYDDWANFAYFSVYLLAGFLLARHPGLEAAIDREWKRALAIALGTSLVLLAALLGAIRAPAVLLAGTGVAGWCYVLALLGAARRFLTFTTPVLRYLQESAFPVYLLHQSAIVLTGYFLVRLPLGIPAKYALLLVASVSATMLVYHFGVRPFRLTRFLTGMKALPAHCPLRAAARSPAAAALLCGCLLAWSDAALAATPEGLWYAEGGAAQVAIERCGARLCGRVVWLRSPFDEDGCTLRDRQNPDPALRNRSIVGLDLLRDLAQSADSDRVWKGGTVYDPTSGRTYACTMELKDERRLEVRGYLGIPLLGRSTTWIRVGTEDVACAP